MRFKFFLRFRSQNSSAVDIKKFRIQPIFPDQPYAGFSIILYIKFSSHSPARSNQHQISTWPNGKLPGQSDAVFAVPLC